MRGESSRFSACLRCTQTCYRTHGKGNFNGSCFFKVMLNDFSTRLRIPPKFVDQMNGLLGPDVILEGPSGQLWHAELCCTDTEVTIESGWENFVLDHAIEIGDFLVFKYAGNSHFIVQIFGKSGCEKQNLFTVTTFGELYLKTENLYVISDQKKQEEKTVQTPVFLENDLLVGIEDKMMEDARKILDTNPWNISIECSGTPVDKMQRSSGARKGKSYAVSEPEAVKIDVSWPGSMEIMQTDAADKGVMALNHAQLSCNKMGQDIKPQRKENKHCVSEHPAELAGKQGALDEALSFKTKKPKFLLVMKKSAVCKGYRLNFPLWFSRRWLPKGGVEITLSGPDKKDWPTKYPGYNSVRFLQGWRHFVVAYDLKQGDVCVFELVNKKIFTFKVHIFWARDHIKPSRAIRTNDEHSNNGRNSSANAKCEEFQATVKCDRFLH